VHKRFPIGLSVLLCIAIVWAILLLDRGGADSQGRRRSIAGIGRVWQQMAQSEGSEIKVDARRGKWPFSHVRPNAFGMPPRQQKEAFALLGRPALLQLRFDSALYARTPTGIGLWLVPGKGVICIFRAVRIASSCSTTAAVYRRGLQLQIFRSGATPASKPTQFTVLGVVPNWANAVSISVDGRRRKLPVVNNAFAGEAKSPIRILGLEKRIDPRQ
jgi:hypothetical protein